MVHRFNLHCSGRVIFFPFMKFPETINFCFALDLIEKADQVRNLENPLCRPCFQHICNRSFLRFLPSALIFCGRQSRARMKNSRELRSLHSKLEMCTTRRSTIPSTWVYFAVRCVRHSWSVLDFESSFGSTGQRAEMKQRLYKNIAFSRQ